MLLPCPAADEARVRLYGIGVAVALAATATVASLAPLALGHRAAAPPVFRRTTPVYAVPVAGGPPRLVRSGSMPKATGRFTATVRHGVLTIRNPSGGVAWRHAVPPRTSEVALAPDGRSAVIVRNGGLQLLGPHRQRTLSGTRLLIDPAFSPDGRLVYALRVKLATSMPK